MRNRIISMVVMMCLIVGISIPMVLPAAGQSVEKDDEHVKVFLPGVNIVRDSTFQDGRGARVIPAWDVNTAGGELISGTRFDIEKTSSYLPVGLDRDMEDITYGEVLWTFNLTMARLPGSTVSLMDDDVPVARLYFDSEKIYYIENGNQYRELARYKPDVHYQYRVMLDFDKKRVTGIYIDGYLVGENFDFTNNRAKANRFSIKTGTEGTGRINLESVYVARGYLINEQFSCNGGNLPSDWEYSASAGGGSSSTAVNGLASFDVGYSVFPASNEPVRFSKTIDPFDKHAIFEFQLLLPEKRNGVQINLNGGEKPILSIGANENSFTYQAKDGEVPFYDYLKNMWYHFRIDVNPETGLASINLNGKRQVSDIPIDKTAMDGVSLEIAAGAGDVWFDNVFLFPYEEVEDYVPEPVELPDDGYEIGMQMCPMWTEGLHFGWEWIQAAPGRAPLLGFYDEGDPEAEDWQIKWMVEHGIDFTWRIWYKGGGPETPMQDTYMSPSIFEGYFNARYSDKLPFAIMWENAVGGIWSSDIEWNKRMFLENVVPFWIEYFFKDPRYYTINGRPLVGAFYIWNTTANFGSPESIREMLDEMCRMCEEAGVGAPLFMQCTGMNETEESTRTIFNEAGRFADMTYQYATGNSWPTQQNVQNELRMQYYQEEAPNLQFVPTVGQGYDAYPWMRGAGMLLNEEQIEETLRYTKDVLIPKNTTWNLGKPIIILPTWDEYGEGHFYAPTVEHGFTLLDAVRRVFYGDQPHEDVVPTEHQKERFNNLYPTDRVMPVREQPSDYSNTVPDGKISKAKWDFTDDMEGWVVQGGSNTVTEVKDGGLHITTDTGTLTLYNENADVQLDGVSHMVIRLKNETSSSCGIFRYTTNRMIDYDPTGWHNFYMPPAGNGEYQDIVIRVDRYPDMAKGIMQKMNIQLTDAYSEVQPGEKMVIDSIELWGDDVAAIEGDKLTLNTNEYITHIDARYAEDGRPLMPIRPVFEALNGTTWWEPELSSVMAKVNGRVVCIDTRNGTCTIDNQPCSSPVPQVIDGVTYATLDFYGELLDKDINWNAAKNTVKISEKEEFTLKRDNSERELLYSWEFNNDGDFEGWGGDWMYNIHTASVADGFLNLTFDSTDPVIYSPYFQGANINTENVKMIAIGYTAEKDFSDSLYYATSNDASIVDAQSFIFKGVATNEVKEAEIVPSSPRWNGNVIRFRMDPGTIANSVSIDYVRLYGDFETELSEEDLLLRYDSMESDEEKMGWNFNLNNSRDGWIFNKNMANIETADGWLHVQSIQADGAMYTASLPELDANSVDTIELRYRNLSFGTEAKLYFMTEGDEAFTEEKSYTIKVLPNDAVGSVYSINVADNPQWQGNITALKLVPSDLGGKFEMDYFYIYTK